MACDHPREHWVGTSAGIICGLCGAPISLDKPAPKKVAESEPAPEKKAEPKKAAAPKKGGAKSVKSK